MCVHVIVLGTQADEKHNKMQGILLSHISLVSLAIVHISLSYHTNITQYNTPHLHY
jgi:hypothetical protein